MEYFEITKKKDYWITRWLKKPTQNERLQSLKNFKNNNGSMLIGIDDVIVEHIIELFKQEVKKNKFYGKFSNDYDRISQQVQMGKPIIMLVLERKGFIDINYVKKTDR